MRYLIFLLPLALSACFTLHKTEEISQVKTIAPPEITDSSYQMVHRGHLGKDSSVWSLNYQYYHTPKLSWQYKTNQTIQNWFRSELEITEAKENNMHGFFEQLADSLNQRANRFYREYEASITWYYRSSCSIDDHRSGFVELCISHQAYFGGEEEQVKNEYFHISKKDTTLLRLGDFFTDTTAFNQIAEHYFKQHQGMREFDIYPEFGFWFEPGGFYCSENFSFEEEEIHFYYHPVEIADASKGIIDFAVPLSAVKHLLK